MNWAEVAVRLAGFAGAVLGWRPDEFWRATPAELAAILSANRVEAAGDPPERAAINRLMEMFPDG